MPEFGVSRISRCHRRIGVEPGAESVRRKDDLERQLERCLGRAGWRRLWPLIIAHVLIDVVAFVGYTFLADVVQGWLT